MLPQAEREPNNSHSTDHIRPQFIGFNYPFIANPETNDARIRNTLVAGRLAQALVSRQIEDNLTFNGSFRRPLVFDPTDSPVISAFGELDDHLINMGMVKQRNALERRATSHKYTPAFDSVMDIVNDGQLDGLNWDDESIQQAKTFIHRVKENNPHARAVMIFGSASVEVDRAQPIGELLGSHGDIILIGGDGRVEKNPMRVVPLAAKAKGNPGCIVVTTDYLATNQGGSVTNPEVIIKAQNMAQRKRIMYELADTFIVLNGGRGTVDEIMTCIGLNLQGLKRGTEKPKDILMFDPPDEQGEIFWKPLPKLLQLLGVENQVQWIRSFEELETKLQ